VDANATPNPGTLGTLRSVDGAGVVRIEDRVDATAADLWSALTDPERLSRWYGDITGDLHEGGQLRIRIDGPDIDATGLVVMCRPPSVLRVQTRETDESARRGQGQPFDQTMDVTLTPDREYTTVMVVEIGGLPLPKIAAYGVGWQLQAESLRSYLCGRSGPDISSRWTELAGPYERLAAQLT
jgi:uncharacterized protein YndB with AHSA1/START domain